MLSLLALASASTGAIDCKAFASRSAQPIEVKIEQISAESLDSNAKVIKPNNSWGSPTYQIGKLVYQGNGYRFLSSDERFPEVVESVEKSLSSICQYEIFVPSGYDAARRKPLERGEITFYRPDQPPEAPPGLTAADQVGARPVLEGYVTRGTWPIYTARGQMFVALMRPISSKSLKNTAIVVFSSKSGPTPAKILASVRGNYSSVSIMPNIHGTGCGFALTGHGSGGSLEEVFLWMDGETEDELATHFATPLQ